LAQAKKDAKAVLTKGCTRLDGRFCQLGCQLGSLAGFFKEAFSRLTHSSEV